MTSVRATMNLSISLAILCALIAIFLPEATYARPTSDQLLSRPKRISDQRLAEIETLLALAKLKGFVVVYPVGYGMVDPNITGRKRRSILKGNLQELRHPLLFTGQGEKLTPEENERVRPLAWQEDTQDEQRDYQLI